MLLISLPLAGCGETGNATAGRSGPVSAINNASAKNTGDTDGGGAAGSGTNSADSTGGAAGSGANGADESASGTQGGTGGTGGTRGQGDTGGQASAEGQNKNTQANATTTTATTTTTTTTTTTKNTFCIYYYATGGKDAPSTQEILKNDVYSIPEAVPERRGYKFIGWSYTKNNLSPLLNAGDPVSITADTAFYAAWQVYLPGDGTEANPYLISTTEELKLLNEFNFENEIFEPAYYLLNADIDMSYAGTDWNNVISFCGVFDGGYKVINGIQQTLFSTIEPGGVVKNLGIENASITTGGAFGNGGIVGDCYGTVERCYVTGSVSSGSRAGGIAAVLRSGCEIKDCYSLADITGEHTTGDIVGDLWGCVSNSYNAGTISSSKDNTGYGGAGAGGIAGFQCGGYIQINNCVSLAERINSNAYVGHFVGLDNGGTNNTYAYKYTVLAGDTTPYDSGITLSKAAQKKFWSGTVGFSPDIWEFADGCLPVLKNFDSPHNTIPEHIKN